MPDYALEGPRWAGTTITWAVNGSVSPDLVPTIAAAFADWAGVSTLRFQQVDFSPAADIQVGEAALDGPDGRLGVTNYAYSGSSTFSASILFDAGEGWHATGTGATVSRDGASLRVAAEHEIGHALGLGHYADGPAVMNPVLTDAVAGLTASDIHGIQALYGVPTPSADAPVTAAAPTIAPAVAPTPPTPPTTTLLPPPTATTTASPSTTSPGTVDHDAVDQATTNPSTTNPSATGQSATGHEAADHVTTDLGAMGQSAAEVALLYYGVLGRAPDADGLHAWAGAVESGMPLTALAQAMVASPEYAALTTGYTNAGAVATLYQDVLGRAGTSGEVAAWTAALDAGTLTRADLARASVTSSEYQGHYAGGSDAAYVQGLYAHVLGRAGEASGVAGWVDALGHGLARGALASAFADGAEFQAKYVGPTDAGFVDGLYVHALGRHADAAGLAGWVDGLAHGMSRADVAIAISEGAEARAHFAPGAEQGWHLT